MHNKSTKKKKERNDHVSTNLYEHGSTHIRSDKKIIQTKGKMETEIKVYFVAASDIPVLVFKLYHLVLIRESNRNDNGT